MKILVRLLLVLVLLVAVGAFGLMTYSGSLIKKAVEAGGSQALGVETLLEGANLDLLGGKLELDGLSVANPPDFGREHFLALGHAEVEVSLGTLRSDKIEAPLLLFDGVEIDLERRGKTTNYGTILENLERGESTDGGDAPAPDTGGGKTLVIHEVILRNVKAHVDFEAGGVSLAKTTVDVPEIRLAGVGERSVAELTREIVTAILNDSVASLEGVLPADVLAGLQSQVAGLEDRAQVLQQELQGELEKGLEDATKKLEESVGESLGEVEKELGKGLGGLLKKDG